MRLGSPTKKSRAAKASAVLAAVGLLLSACASDPDATPRTPASPATNSDDTRSVLSPPPQATLPPKTPAASGSASTVNCDYQRSGSPAKAVDMPAMNDIPAHGQAVLTLEMTEGNVTITMDRQAAPCTVNSFQALASQGYFDDTKCHRLVDQGIFVLQCGDPSGTGRGGPGYRFPDELSGSEKYPAGTVAMANAGPNTNGSQFFLVWADTQLPPSYTVFGQLDDASLGVVQQIAAKGVSRDASPNPISPAQIKRVSAG